MENVKKMIDSLFHKISYTFRFLKKRIHIKINIDSVLEHIIALELYTLLTILAFHKLFILGIDKVLIGDGGDAYHYVWNFWWVKKAILEGGNIFYTDYLFYPYGVFLIFHALNLSFSLLSIIFSNFLDGVVIYNLFVLFSFVISGWLMFYLSKKISKNFFISFLVGLLFSFSYYHVGKSLGHLDLSQIWFLPLLAILILSLTKANNKCRKLIIALLISTLLTISAYTSYYMFTFTLISLLLVPMYISIENKKTYTFYTLLNFYKSFIPWILVILTLVFVSILPLVYLYSNVDKKYIPSPPTIETISNSPEKISIIDYFIPPPWSLWVLTNLFPSIYKLRSPENLSILPSFGFSLLLLLVLTSVYIILKEKNIKLFTIFNLLVMFFLICLSLGPIIYIPFSNIKIVSPIYILTYRYIPFFNYIISPSRFSIVVLFFILIFLTQIYIRIKGNENLRYLFICLLFIAAIEIFPFFYNFYSTAYKDEVNFLSSLSHYNSESGTILNLPPYFCESNYFQVYHQFKIKDGCVSRSTGYIFSDMTHIFSNCNFTEIYKKFNITYIIVFKNKWSKEWGECINFVTNNFRKVYESNNILIFSLTS